MKRSRIDNRSSSVADMPAIGGLSNFLREASMIAKEMIWPTRCAICDLSGDLVCASCLNELEYIDSLTACRRCGSPFGCLQCCECNDQRMNDMDRDTFPLDRLSSAVHIDERSKRIITTYKDENERRLCRFISLTMSRYIDPDWIDGNDMPVLTYIPCTQRAFDRRGFDHAAEIAQEIARLNDLESMGIFKRPKSTDQRQLGRRERAQNMSKTFEIIPNVNIPSKVIIVDDICTTGSTLYSAADVLRDNHVSQIYALTFGKVI